MAVLSVVGAQWGDEGKGKLTDYLAQEADVVIRHQGGNNAGHSIVIDGVRYALNLIPSGIFQPHIKNVLANGMVINIKALLAELKALEEQGITDYQLFISDRAHVVMPYHLELDALQEEQKGDRKIGTTKKGIGPAYTDKASRVGIRIIDMYDDELFFNKIKMNVERKNELFRAGGKEEMDADAIYQEYKEYRDQIKKFVTDTSVLIYNEYKEGKKILFEGAQGVLLCLDHGTYPFVTSSSPTSSSAPLNAGIPTQMIDKSLGIVKAYSTRVGTGGFPTEFEDATAEKIREVGREYGTVTGRPRRIGWFDAMLIKHGARVSGFTDLAITLLDVLTGIETIKIATHYKLGEEIIDYIPAGEKDFVSATPVYIELPGWEEDITQVKSFDELPENAKNYIRKIEELTGVQVSVFSVGPDREQTITINNLFE